MSVENGENAPTKGGNEGSQQVTKRAERKRQREKKRRGDLSNAFDELASFIMQVDPQSGRLHAHDAKKKRKTCDGKEDASGISRIELIGTAIRIMRRFHRENEEKKLIIASIREKSVAGANENFVVMEPYPVARAHFPPYSGYPPHYYHGSHPQAPVSVDYGRQVASRGPSPQYNSQWAPYNGHDGPPVMNPHGAPPPYGAAPMHHPMAAQEQSTYSGPPTSVWTPESVRGRGSLSRTRDNSSRMLPRDTIP